MPIGWPECIVALRLDTRIHFILLLRRFAACGISEILEPKWRNNAESCIQGRGRGGVVAAG